MAFYYSSLPGGVLCMGAVYFAFQIYGDFSGYSDIAIGTSKIFGFKLMKNFNFLYFARDIAEFWRRWHISLSTWFRDYLYIPLGGSKGGTWMKVRNTFIIFIVSGFWHGANWTFIIWGALNAIYFLPLLLGNKNRVHMEIVAKGKYLPTFKEVLAMFTTFSLTLLAWVFFRADSVGHALSYLNEIFSVSLFSSPVFDTKDNFSFFSWIMLFFILVEWLGREDQFAIEKFISKWKVSFRWIFYFALLMILFYLRGEQQEFIYFQF